jgi:hypothetical protein
MNDYKIGAGVKIFTPRVLNADEVFETPLAQQRAMERYGVIVARNREKGRLLIEFTDGTRIPYLETEVMLIDEAAPARNSTAPLSLFSDDELPNTYGRNGR